MNHLRSQALPRLEPLLAGDPELTELKALPTEEQVAMEMLGPKNGNPPVMVYINIYTQGICVYVYIYIYIFVYVYVYVCISMYICVRI